MTSWKSIQVPYTVRALRRTRSHKHRTGEFIMGPPESFIVWWKGDTFPGVAGKKSGKTASPCFPRNNSTRVWLRSNPSKTFTTSAPHDRVSPGFWKARRRWLFRDVSTCLRPKGFKYGNGSRVWGHFFHRPTPRVRERGRENRKVTPKRAWIKLSRGGKTHHHPLCRWYVG